MPDYDCVICRTNVPYVGKLPPLYPFCCEHCRLVDLGLWFREAYAIDRDVTPEDAGDLRASLLGGSIDDASAGSDASR